ncbi:MAG: hypothetical protein Q9191_007963 [Dirinaria sp. TL-2023a]
MVPPRRRLAQPVSSPRYLSLRHGRKLVRTLDGDSDCDPNKEGKLGPGEEHLHSFYVPGLTGGLHTVTVNQDITVAKSSDPNQNPDKSVGPPAPQEFSVLAPRFELPDDAVYSMYPPPGSSATHEILPHVLFNDPTLPWERVGSTIADKRNPPDHNSNRVPWLACLVFEPNELQLSAAELADVYKSTSIAGQAEQDKMMSVKTPIAELNRVGSTTAILPIKDGAEATKPDTSLIFLPASVFDAIFASYDDDGARLADQKVPDVSRHRFLAHLREINTTGMAHADREDEQAEREFSVIVSNRTGPLTASADNQPSQVIVHIVSLEGVDKMPTFPVTGSFGRVGLVSLYSWTYMCLPPNSLNVHSSFVNMSEGLRMLQPDIDFGNLPKNPNIAAPRMYKRLQDGYSVVRHRTQTGEETVALFRGPLVPSLSEAKNLDVLSNSGSGLQILDKGLGLMDITYTAAWSLGRTLALANRPYATALTRVRRQILCEAADEASSKAIRATGTLYQSKEDLTQSLADNVERILCVSKSPPTRGAACNSNDSVRFKHGDVNTADLSYRSVGVSYFLESALDEAAYKVASTSDPKPKDWPEKYDPPYNEFNTPRSPDWVLVLRFVLDLYHLDQVPSHYLLTDQSHLPPESFRIFLVDPEWVNAFIDGGLSLGNHGGLDNYRDSADDALNVVDDPVRRSIKKAVNRYLTTPIKGNPGQYRPPVPRFGFYMRSAVVAAFPDLKVTCSPETNTYSGPMLLKHDIVDKDVMLWFFSGEPLAKELNEMLFSMPAHQQYFSAGSELSPELLKANYKRMYTVRNPTDDKQNKSIAEIEWKRSNGGKGTRTDKTGEPVRPPIFVWGSDSSKSDVRLLLVDKLASDVFTTVTAEMNARHDGWFQEKCPTSVMLGMQLNSPAWQLQIAKLCENLNASVKIHEISPCLEYKSARTLSGPPELKRHGDKVVFSARLSSRQDLRHGLKTKQNPPHFRRVPIIPPKYDQDYDHDHKDISDDSPVSTPESWSVVSSPALLPEPDRANVSVPPYASGSNPRVEDTTPTYVTKIFSTGSTDKTLIPMIHKRQDIIFSIVYDRRGTSWALTGFTISIPIGPITDKDRKNLSSTIPSSGAIAMMVSNLRFNVRASYSQTGKKLKLEAKPRSRSGKVSMDNWIGKYVDDDDQQAIIDVGKRTEISVVLYGVKVNRYPADKYPDGADVVIDYEMDYTGSKSDPFTKVAKLRLDAAAEGIQMT